MKKILGLDLGSTSIGWALVNEAENNDEKSSIIRLGVRVNPLTTDEKSNFESGKSITTNADRTSKRGMRRNLQRYKLRRQYLIDTLKRNGWITDETILAEQGNYTTFETLRLRAKAAEQEISLEEFARVLLSINKKRGYKSNRKVNNNEEEGQIIDGMAIAEELKDKGLTPGQLTFSRMQGGNYKIPDFYQSDLLSEYDMIWDCQSRYYPNILTAALKTELSGKSAAQTTTICMRSFSIVGAKRTTKGQEAKKEVYEWRSKAVSEQVSLEELAIVLQDINFQIKKTENYLGRISNRSKELSFNNLTVGQYMMSKLDSNPHYSFRNAVFYRKDYLDEFETIWYVQSKYHPELTDDLKKEIRDAIIFYQRPLKSQKGLVAVCELEGRETEIIKNGKKTKAIVGPKVCPKSSPLFQEFKIWQYINNIKVNGQPLSAEDKVLLANELCLKDKMSKSEVLKLLFSNPKELDMNFKEVEGNRTQAALFDAYSRILEDTGHECNFSKMTSEEALNAMEKIFKALGYKTDFLRFDSSLEGKDFENQPAYRLWHLIYSYEGDKSASGEDSLVDKICELTGFSQEQAKILAKVKFAPDYGSLSTKAMRKILPFMKDGMRYDEACVLAGYRHSKNSLTREELDAKELKDHMEILPKDSLRNPVVEKILNQMVNVVNEIIDTYGKPDEIRLEMARELKKSAEERQKMSEGISKANAEHEKYKQVLKEEFGIQEPSRNDIIKYKLYKELEPYGYKTLYSNTYIPKEKLFFGNEFDIEHIIPKTKLFDDSFGNKTIEKHEVNLKKSNATAYDFVKQEYGDNGLADYETRVNQLFKDHKISKTKRDRLLMPEQDIPDGFIDRDLRDSQYIARKAKSTLEEIVRDVVTTTGSVTDRLRQDWQLVDVMKELNWDKYNKVGMAEIVKDRDGRPIRKIKDWTKRNDHRHHAMDALTIAFTKRSYIQYLNNLNARIPEEFSAHLSEFSLDDVPWPDITKAVFKIEKTQMYSDGKGKRRFIPPIPLDEFRTEAKRQLENVLVSIKAKNKVTTRNVNITKKAGGAGKKVQFTPRGQLHNETVYGKINRYDVKEEKVGPSFTADKIARVAKASYRAALEQRLAQYDNDSKKAFSGKNSLAKNPLYVDEMHSACVPEKVRLVSYESRFTKRVAVSSLIAQKNVDDIVDVGIRKIVQARVDEYNGDVKKALANIDENPIWLNKDKGIQIKRVTVYGVQNAVPLHDQKDNLGRLIHNEEGNTIPVDYVSTSNNHHIAIYDDGNGNLQEHVVSFYDVVARIGLGLPIVDREYKKDEGWQFMFTMKQNEYFVFPNPETGFDPSDIDLMNPDNYSLISPNLFRVQKLTTKDYFFRHHLETNVATEASLRDLTWKRLRNENALKGVVKVRINHIGQIVQVGEY